MQSSIPLVTAALLAGCGGDGGEPAAPPAPSVSSRELTDRVPPAPPDGRAAGAEPATAPATPARPARANHARPAVPGRYRSRDYWDFADRRQRELDHLWTPRRGLYRAPGGGADGRLNANLLTAHALAALAGHRGPARQDARARSIARRLVREPAFVTSDEPYVVVATQSHAPGWSASTRAVWGQHVAVDAAMAEALGTAHRARFALRMPRALTDRIGARVHAVAMGEFHRFPAIRLNQFNWHADLYAQDGHSSGDPRLLRGDYRRQLRRFVYHVGAPVPGGGAYLNAGLGLNYVPSHGADRSHTSEYANLVLSGLIHYDGAVARGMTRLPAGEEAVLREWRERVLYGDWTHAGYLNWDTSLGFRRWHLTRYWALSGYGLLTLAGPGRLASRPERGYAKWLLDRYFERYERWSRRAGGLLGSTSFITATERAHVRSDPALVASRFEAHAARAAFLGLGRPGRRGTEPPPFFAHDPDVRRVAISTPRYNTALVQADRTGSGGLEPIRLYTGAQDPVTGTGSAGPGALGLEVVRRGRVVLDTQPGRAGTALARAVERGPWTVTNPGGSAERGTFERLEASNQAANRLGDSVGLTHRFTRGTITSARTVRSQAGGTVALRFPVWGARGSARVLEGRRWRPLPAGGRPVGDATVLALRGQRAAYAASVGGLPPGARVERVRVAPHPASPETRTVLRVSFPLARGATVTTTVRLSRIG